MNTHKKLIAELPERDATPDEAFELGWIAGYDEAVAERDAALEARQPSEDDREAASVHEITVATVAFAKSLVGEGADHEDHDYYRKHVGVALDAVARAAAPGAATDVREYLHAKCDCVPDLGPAHCHFCGDDNDSPVPWAECEAVTSADSATGKVQAELDEMAGRFAEFLCEVTGSMLSYTHYSVATMTQYTEEYFERHFKEYHDDYCEKAEALEAERDAALAAIERIRAAADTRKPVGLLAQDMIAALDGAPEPEWEYGLLNPQAPDGGKLQGGAHLISENREHIIAQQRKGHPVIQAVRRRKAGPWEPLPVGGENDGE